MRQVVKYLLKIDRLCTFIEDVWQPLLAKAGLHYRKYHSRVREKVELARCVTIARDDHHDVSDKTSAGLYPAVRGPK